MKGSSLMVISLMKVPCDPCELHRLDLKDSRRCCSSAIGSVLDFCHPIVRILTRVTCHKHSHKHSHFSLMLE